MYSRYHCLHLSPVKIIYSKTIEYYGNNPRKKATICDTGIARDYDWGTKWKKLCDIILVT